MRAPAPLPCSPRLTPARRPAPPLSPSPGHNQESVLHAAALAAKWKEPPRDALDTLVLTSAKLEECNKYEQIDFMPFDPTIKRTEGTLRGPDGKVFKTTKGAPHIILKLIEVDQEEVTKRVNWKVMDLGRRGIRSLAVAQTNDEGKWQMLGILTFLDPPRPDTKETIENSMKLGVDVKMITGGCGVLPGVGRLGGFADGSPFAAAAAAGAAGARHPPPCRPPLGPARDPTPSPASLPPPPGDHQVIAKETARQLGLGTNIPDAANLPTMDADGKIPKDLGKKYGKMILDADGFAQVGGVGRARLHRQGLLPGASPCRRPARNPPWLAHPTHNNPAAPPPPPRCTPSTST
jgi:hypothetical protein